MNTKPQSFLTDDDAAPWSDSDWQNVVWRDGNDCIITAEEARRILADKIESENPQPVILNLPAAVIRRRRR